MRVYFEHISPQWVSDSLKYLCTKQIQVGKSCCLVMEPKWYYSEMVPDLRITQLNLYNSLILMVLDIPRVYYCVVG